MINENSPRAYIAETPDGWSITVDGNVLAYAATAEEAVEWCRKKGFLSGTRNMRYHF